MEKYTQKEKERIIRAYWSKRLITCPKCRAKVICKKVNPPNQILWLIKCECKRCGMQFEWTPDEDKVLRKKPKLPKGKVVKPKKTRYI
ncbi:hypothetical protein KAX02_05825 [candidate division WOR-3 bacterium]|nr:hypothetical protein [candidate division WOR-3 bacterium]